MFRNDWHVYSKRPFGGAEHALCYLGHYTHRVVISNHRLVSLADEQVTFRWRDSAHHNEHKLMTLTLDEFLRRFLLHLLPKGFVRIRHFGFLANPAYHSPAALLSTTRRRTTVAIRTRRAATQAAEPALALSQMRRPHGGHRETYRGPAPTPFSALSHRSHCMTLPFRSLSVGASHHPRGAPWSLPTKLLASSFRSQTTI